MKKLFAVVCALLLGASLSFAQTGGGTTDTKTGTGKTTDTGKKAKTRSHSHGKKGGKKDKKSSATHWHNPKSNAKH
jgi:hypothetical protein